MGAARDGLCTASHSLKRRGPLQEAPRTKLIAGEGEHCEPARVVFVVQVPETVVCRRRRKRERHTLSGRNAWRSVCLERTAMLRRVASEPRRLAASEPSGRHSALTAHECHKTERHDGSTAAEPVAERYAQLASV